MLGQLLFLIIKLMPIPINMKGTNILANNPRNRPRVIETPVKIKMTKVKIMEKIKTIKEIKHPNIITIPFFKNKPLYYLLYYNGV